MNLQIERLVAGDRTQMADPQRELLAVYGRWLVSREQRGQFVGEMTIAASWVVAAAVLLKIFDYQLSQLATESFRIAGVIGFVATTLLAGSFLRARSRAALSEMELLAMRLELAGAVEKEG